MKGLDLEDMLARRLAEGGLGPKADLVDGPEVADADRAGAAWSRRQRPPLRHVGAEALRA